jgi:hypothetical protein
MNWKKILENKKNFKIALIIALILSLLISALVTYVFDAIIMGTILFFLLAGIIVVIAVAVGKKQKSETDYRMFFILGAAFLPIGVATGNYGFLGLAIIYIIIGLKNKDKWKKK